MLRKTFVTGSEGVDAVSEAGVGGSDAWIGRAHHEEGRLDPALAGMLGATLRGDWAAQSRWSPGEIMPLLWHWAAFPPTAPRRALGEDGHPRRGDDDGGFPPDVGLDRRMWAGGALRFHQPLRIGEGLTRRSRIDSVKDKTGAAGRMVFVTVEHEIDGERGLAISERQDIVYLKIPERFTPPEPILAPDSPKYSDTVAVDPVLLFRYSACTFNGHRIHYDLPYATEVEKYPGLVVHGPLQASLLIDAATRWRGAPPTGFRFRGVRPMFHFNDLRMLGVETSDGGLDLCTAEPSGAQGMKARADWAQPTNENNH